MHHQAAPVTPVLLHREPRMVIHAATWKTNFGITSEKRTGVAICAETFGVDQKDPHLAEECMRKLLRMGMVIA